MMLCELRPQDLNPPYWVMMGACAITLLARIIERVDARWPPPPAALIGGLSVMFWAFATCGPRRRRLGAPPHPRVPLKYGATLWSLVFPRGMYAVAGIYLGQAN